MTTESEDTPIDVDALGWDTHEPPPGFAERVTDAFVSAPARPASPRRGTPWRWIGTAVAAAAACALWIAWPSDRSSHDAIDTEVLRTVAIHDRALAVARPG